MPRMAANYVFDPRTLNPADAVDDGLACEPDLEPDWDE